MVLIGRYLDTVRQDAGPLVARKLSSALATLFFHFHKVWRHFLHHLVLCLVSGQSHQLDALDGAPSFSTLAERLDSNQTQAALWVLSNVLEDVTKFDLNSVNKLVHRLPPGFLSILTVHSMGLYDAVLENLTDAVSLMSRGMSPSLGSRAAHKDSIKCFQVSLIFIPRRDPLEYLLIYP